MLANSVEVQLVVIGTDCSESLKKVDIDATIPHLPVVLASNEVRIQMVFPGVTLPKWNVTSY